MFEEVEDDVVDADSEVIETDLALVVGWNVKRCGERKEIRKEWR